MFGTTNPHVMTKSMIFRPRIYLVVGYDSEPLSIYSTNLSQGGNIPIFGNQSIARIVRAGGTEAHPLFLNAPLGFRK